MMMYNQQTTIHQRIKINKNNEDDIDDKDSNHNNHNNNNTMKQEQREDPSLSKAKSNSNANSNSMVSLVFFASASALWLSLLLGMTYLHMTTLYSSSASSTTSDLLTTTTTTTTTNHILLQPQSQSQHHEDDASSKNNGSRRRQLMDISLAQYEIYNQQSADVPRRRPKVLVGILSRDTFDGAAYRTRHRTLFEIWKDPRVCSLPDYRYWTKTNTNTTRKESCQLIYTFIIGANQDKSSGPMEIVDNSTQPLVLDRMVHPYREDINAPDCTLLNIQENMNQGKSQTFFYFATLVMKELQLDYTMKLDADAMLHLSDYFLFAHYHLPPPPYNTNIFAGALRNKAGWPPKTEEQIRRMNQLESFWGMEYEGVHLYMAGQMYILSLDLAEFVVQEAPMSRIRIGQGGYIEGHEDHDIASMAFHSPSPVHLITIGKSQRFWEHPVKGQPRWNRIVIRENARMAGARFEGRILRFYKDI